MVASLEPFLPSALQHGHAFLLMLVLVLVLPPASAAALVAAFRRTDDMDFLLSSFLFSSSLRIPSALDSYGGVSGSACRAVTQVILFLSTE